MAEKPAAVAEETKPPVYEVSPKWILIYQTVNLILAVVVFFCSYKYDIAFPVVIYFFAHAILLEIQYIRYFLIVPMDIAKLIYHADLLPDKEFFHLVRCYDRVACKIQQYKNKGKDVPAKHQDKFETLKPVFEAQKELRAVCWFTWLVGAPKSTSQENNVVDIVEEKDHKDEKKNSTKKTSEATNVETHATSSYSEDESESDFSTTDDELDSEADSSSSDSDDSDLSVISSPASKIKDSTAPIDISADELNNVLNARIRAMNKAQKVLSVQPYKIAFYDEPVNTFSEDLEVALAAEVIKNEIKQTQLEAIEKKQPATTSSINNLEEKIDPKNELEEIQLQFAEMKAENEKLKNSLEKLIAAQNVF